MVRLHVHHGKAPGSRPHLFPAGKEQGRTISVWLSLTGTEPVCCRFFKETFLREAIEPLTSKQRAHLRSLAHPLSPVVHIGKDGVNESTIQAAKEALNTRELLKIRVLDAAPLDAGETAQKLIEQIRDAVLVQVIGHVFVVYKPFTDHPDIRLPA